MDPPAEAREEEICPVPQAQQPLPSCPICSPKEAPSVAWAFEDLLEMSGSPPWQAAKILFTALKANSYSFLLSGPFLKNIKLLAHRHHFLLGLNQWCLASGQGQPSKDSTAAPANAQRPVHNKASAWGFRKLYVFPFLITSP